MRLSGTTLLPLEREKKCRCGSSIFTSSHSGTSELENRSCRSLERRFNSERPPVILHIWRLSAVKFGYLSTMQVRWRSVKIRADCSLLKRFGACTTRDLVLRWDVVAADAKKSSRSRG